MTRFNKEMGKYKINGHTYETLVGSRAQVWHGTSYKTSGGLTKKELIQNKAGRLVSKSKHETAKKEKRLVKSGYGTKKGHFGFVKLHKSKSKKSKTIRMKGGSHTNLPLSPSDYDGKGVGTSGVELQFIAGNAN